MSDLWSSLAPTLALVGLFVVALPYLDRDDRRVRLVLGAGCILLMARYVIWRLMATLPALDGSMASIWAYGFFALECSGIVSATILLHMLSRSSTRRAEADRNTAWFAGLPTQPLVDVFIATYNEERAILERTIVGALAMSYPNCRVWVLDDGRRPWLRRLCAEKRAGYLTRPDNLHAKAGNLNAALRHVMGLERRPDFIMVLDADFVPHRNFLARTMPLFRDPRIGIVQTPQHFFNPDPLQGNFSAFRTWPDEPRLFFDTLLEARDAHGTAFCCGTSSVARVDGLLRVGGFPSESVTEDMLLTLKFQTIGYTTAYLNERLSMGLAPEGLQEYLTQRGRWCLGAMQIVRGAWGPFTRRRVPFLMRLHTFDTFLYWAVSPLFRLVALAAPVVFWLTGASVLQTDLESVLWYGAPCWLASNVMISWVSRGRCLPLISDATQLLSSFESLKGAGSGLFVPGGKKFKVTAKGVSRDRVVVQWSLLRWFVAGILLTVGSIAYHQFAAYAPATDHDTQLPVLFWSYYNIAVLLVACCACVELPRRRLEERFATDEVVRVEGAESGSARLCDLSVGGARLASPTPAPVGTALRLVFDDGLAVPAQVVRSEATAYAVAFQQDDPARLAMIRRVFSGRYGNTVTQARLRDVMGSVVRKIVTV